MLVSCNHTDYKLYEFGTIKEGSEILYDLYKTIDTGSIGFYNVQLGM